MGINNRRKDLTKEFLYEEYVNKNKTMEQIAIENCCSASCISVKIKKFGIKEPTNTRYIGKTFGSLTPIKRIGKDKSSHAMYLCICECGKKKKVLGYSLKTKNTKSCGCNSRKRGKNHKYYRGYEDIRNHYWVSLKNGAKDRGFIFNITIVEIWNLFLKQNRKCALSGIEIKFADDRDNFNETQTASLDRKDSKKGYILDNLQWVHKDLNKLKNNMSEDKLFYYCKHMYNHLKNKYEKAENSYPKS